MSKAIRCDVCGRSTPDVGVNFSRRKSSWYEYHFDSQGGYEQKLDVCDYCWKSYQSFCQNRLGQKEAKNGTDK